MTVKEKFMEIKDHKEYQKRRKEFETLDISDPEVIEHFDEIFPKLDNSDFKKGIIVDVQKEKPKTKE